MLLRDIKSYSAIYLACGATDLRKSVDGLATIVKQDFKLNPFGNYLFLFCNKNRNRMKGLCWVEDSSFVFGGVRNFVFLEIYANLIIK